MIFIFPLIYCNTLVVKIMHKDEDGNSVAIMAEGGRLVATSDMYNDKADFIFYKDNMSHRPKVEIRPVMDQGRKVVLAMDGTVKLASQYEDYKKWTVKRDRSKHKLFVDNMCLSVRGTNVGVESCMENSLNQEFVISDSFRHDSIDHCTSLADCAYKEGQYEHWMGFSPRNFIHGSHSHHHRPEPIVMTSTPFPYRETEDTHYIVTSTLLVRTTQTFTDTVLKNVTFYVTSTTTETRTIGKNTVTAPALLSLTPPLVKKVIKKSTVIPKSGLNTCEDSEDHCTPASLLRPKTMYFRREAMADSDSSSIDDGLESLIDKFSDSQQDTDLLRFIKAPIFR